MQPDFFVNGNVACLKNHSRNLHAPLCGIFRSDSVVVARYDNRIRAKSPTNYDAHLTESLFQTCSRAYLFLVLSHIFADAAFDTVNRIQQMAD